MKLTMYHPNKYTLFKLIEKENVFESSESDTEKKEDENGPAPMIKLKNGNLSLAGDEDFQFGRSESLRIQMQSEGRNLDKNQTPHNMIDLNIQNRVSSEKFIVENKLDPKATSDIVRLRSDSNDNMYEPVGFRNKDLKFMKVDNDFNPVFIQTDGSIGKILFRVDSCS